MQRYSYKSVSHTKWHVFFVLLKLIVNNTRKRTPTHDLNTGEPEVLTNTKNDPDSFLNQGRAMKDGGLLLSRIALQYHRRKRA